MSGPLARDLADYLAHLRVERGLAENTLRAYRHDLERYAGFLADARVPALAAAHEGHIEGFLAHLADSDLNQRSRNRALAAVRGWHKFATLEGRAEVDPARDVAAPRPALLLPHPLPVDDVTRLLAAAGHLDEATHPRTLRDIALLELLYGCGARISEAVGLDLDDVDLDGRSVRLFGKGRKERVVPLGRYASAALGAYLVRGRPVWVREAHRASPAVFVNARGGRLSRQSGWATLKRVAEVAGLGAEVTPHTLRHSYATHLMQGGADVRVVQELLGHASVTTTQIYTQVTVDSLREVHAAAHPRAH
ncbi:site-specific tyrosine recombinase XerD [Micrococcales bacterium 31B]|nr:site-specific tyrosine recombinase XerD [Micrococcales bacterium 31B]